jgi:hypothetical protein
MTTPSSPRLHALALAAASGMIVPAAQGFTFESGSIKGSFDSTVTTGLAVRAKDPACALIGDPSVCPGADVFGWAGGDDGNLNYRKGQLFATYLKGNHELLLNLPDEWKFLGRVSWLLDGKAADTARTPLSSDARREIARDVRLLDFWVGKSLQIGEQRASVRLGNQFINWGESLFLPGGINASNPVDVQRLSQPGTQLKEAFLPVPTLSLSTGLAQGLSLEAYYQFGWKRSKVPPVGGYWSVGDIYDKGREPIYLGLDPAASRALGQPASATIPVAADATPRQQGQWGAALRWQPEGTSLNLGAYAINYHDKMPNLQFGADGAQWRFLQDRKLFGLSANFALGHWAVGTELSYRPKDAISLSGCFVPGAVGNNINGAYAGACEQFITSKRYQWHLTGMLNLTPADHGWLLKALGADGGTLLAESVVVHMPGLQSQYARTAPDGGSVVQLPAAGLWGWSKDGGASVYGAGTKTSAGFNLDFSWTYDGSLIPGWQVTPEIFYAQAVKGRTPTLVANFMQQARSANLIVTFTQNPAHWQFAINYAKFWGGKASFDQPYADRDFFGAFLSRNF